MSKLRYVRWTAGFAIAGYLFFYFVPLVPFTQKLSCNPPPGGDVFGCGPIPAGGSYSGLNSIGYSLTGWGAQLSGWLGGYVPPFFHFGTNTLTASGALIFVVGSLSLCLVAIAIPEILDGIEVLSNRFRHHF